MDKSRNRLNSCIRHFRLMVIMAILAVTGLTTISARGSKPASGQRVSCPVKRVAAKRLPDLNIPRIYHTTIIAGGRPTVIGGHTDGFVPTPTIEYLEGGEWHVVETVYDHDDGLIVPLADGRVLIAGGYEQPLGISQTFPMEYYDPASHECTGFGCLDVKRAKAAGVEIDSGRVVICGNWYHRDGVELFNGAVNDTYIKDVSQTRCYPHILPYGRGNAAVFAACDWRGHRHDTIVVDRLEGGPFCPPLLQEWRPLMAHFPFSPTSGRVAYDARSGVCTYLIAVENRQGAVALATMKWGGERDSLPVFDLLPTDCAVPVTDPGCRERLSLPDSVALTDSLRWLPPVVVDEKARKAYLLGLVADARHDVHQPYLLQIDYASTPAAISLMYTENMPDVAECSPVLTPEGNLLMAGGKNGTNFFPHSSAVLLMVGGDEELSACQRSFVIAGLTLLGLLLACLIFVRYRHRTKQSVAVTDVPESIDQPADSSDQSADSSDQPADSSDRLAQRQDELMQRIDELMQGGQLYLNSELKLKDVADRLTCSTRAVSECIKEKKQCNFALYVNCYRVDHAKRLLTTDTQMKVSAVGLHSGFNNETSFFRAFRAITGMSPTEWAAASQKGEKD